MAMVIKHNMKFRVVMMSPEWAKELLAHNHKNNRRIKDRRVNSYSREMAQDIWLLTHQPVAVDEDGWLIDNITLEPVANSIPLSYQLNPVDVPEPATYAAFSGLALLAWAVARHRVNPKHTPTP